MYSTLTFDSPAIFDNWFQYAHEIHDHNTRASSEVIRENHFDVGWSIPYPLNGSKMRVELYQGPPLVEGFRATVGGFLSGK